MSDALLANRASADVVSALQRAHDALTQAQHLQCAMASVIDTLVDRVSGAPGDYGLVCALESCVWSLRDKIEPSIDETTLLLLRIKKTEASHG